MATLAQAIKSLGMSRSGVIYRIQKGFLKAKMTRESTYRYVVDDTSLRLNISLKKPKRRK